MVNDIDLGYLMEFKKKRELYTIASFRYVSELSFNQDFLGKRHAVFNHIINKEGIIWDLSESSRECETQYQSFEMIFNVFEKNNIVEKFKVGKSRVFYGLSREIMAKLTKLVEEMEKRLEEK